MREAERRGCSHVTNVPYDPTLPWSKLTQGKWRELTSRDTCESIKELMDLYTEIYLYDCSVQVVCL